MIFQGFKVFNGEMQSQVLNNQNLFEILRATFFILALSMTFICLIKFLYQMNKRNLVRLLITGFPIGVSLIYIIYGSIVFFR
jgi:hypothetical protein